MAAEMHAAADRQVFVDIGIPEATRREIAGLSGGRIVLPNPGTQPSAEAAAAVRGRADALALRLAHHDEAAHVSSLPSGATARAIFNAAEQARVEGLGARDMKGMGDNLDAALTYPTPGDPRVTRPLLQPGPPALRLSVGGCRP